MLHSASQSAVGRPMEILLVEDNLMDAQAAIGALQGQVKHRLTLIRDGAEALEFLHRQGKFARAPRPDLVLLDLVLPKKDGLEVLAELRADKDFDRIPVVVLTGSDHPEDRERCEFLQIDAYMEKPVNLDKFLHVIRELKRFWMNDVLLPTLD